MCCHQKARLNWNKEGYQARLVENTTPYSTLARKAAKVSSHWEAREVTPSTRQICSPGELLV